MITVFRYSQMKPRDGKLEFSYHRDGAILGVTEVYRKDGGWHVCLDVLVDTAQPVERRRFFLCTGGDDLSALGESAFAYHVGTNATKGYCSYLFDVSHLPDQVIAKLDANWERLTRPAPTADELSYKARAAREREERKKVRSETMEQRRARINARAGVVQHASETTKQIVDSRRAADTERAEIEQAELRLVEGG